jgi:hypothetical protein
MGTSTAPLGCDACGDDRRLASTAIGPTQEVRFTIGQRRRRAKIRKALGFLAELLGNNERHHRFANDFLLQVPEHPDKFSVDPHGLFSPRSATAFVRISCANQWANQQDTPGRAPTSPSSKKQHYPHPPTVPDLWQARQISVSGSFASRYSVPRTLGAKRCQSKHIGLIHKLRVLLAPQLPYPCESG